MKKPAPLVELIEDLKQDSKGDNTVAASSESYAIIFPTDDAFMAEDGIRLTPEECELLFHDDDTVSLLMDALNGPQDAALLIHALEMTSEAMDALERRFASVDEA